MKASRSAASAGAPAAMTLGHQSSVLVDRALDLLASGPVDSKTLVTRVCQLPAVAGPLADHLATALLGGDDRFRRTAIGWQLASMIAPAPPPVVGAVHEPKPKYGFALPLPLVVVDVETTGSGAWKGDRITEVAAVRVAGGSIEVVFDSLINPQRPIPRAATAITSITSEMVHHAPTFRQIAPQLAGVLEGHVFVGHNAGFDWRFISMEMERAIGRPLVGHRICTVKLARKLVPTLRRRSLDHLAHHYGIEITQRHRAGGDALATAKVLIKLLDAARDAGLTTLEDLDAFVRRAPGRRKNRRRRSAMPTSFLFDTPA